VSTKNEPPPRDELDSIDDVETTAEELAEAAQLARALERGTASQALGQDALEAVALLRAASRPTLEPARQTAIFEELQPALEKQRQRGRARPRGAWLWWVGTAFGAAALLLLVQRNDPAGAPGASAKRTSAESAGVVPAPSPALLEAQAALLSEGNAEQQLRFEREMSRYRDRVLASLEER
jgi:hypothetical protein